MWRNRCHACSSRTATLAGCYPPESRGCSPRYADAMESGGGLQDAGAVSTPRLSFRDQADRFGYSAYRALTILAMGEVWLSVWLNVWTSVGLGV